MKKHRGKFDTISLLIVIAFVSVDIFLWHDVTTSTTQIISARTYFFDVTQGDSEMVIFQDNIKILIDAGADGSAAQDLEKVLPSEDNYIDLAIISDAQSENFGGYTYILDHYNIGAFVYDGRVPEADPSSADSKAWLELMEKIQQKNIPLITLGAGDRITYGENSINIISPNEEFAQSADVKETGLVELVNTANLKELFTANISPSIENFLLSQNSWYGKNVSLRADVLKVADHASKYSSSVSFLKAVSPSVAIIEAGSTARAGQPSKEALARLASSTNAVVLRTDHDGIIEVWSEDGKLKLEKL
jgi:competence protein ComEC